MSGNPGALRPLTSAPPRNEDEQLRRMSHELEGLFLRQLFQAMRESVPQSGLTGDSTAEEMFQSLLDDRLSSEASSRMRNGIGEALYQQIRSRLKTEGDPKP